MPPDPIYNPQTEVLAEGRDGSLRAVPIAEADQVAASGGRVLGGDEANARLQDAARYAETQTAGGQARSFFTAGASGVLSPFAALAGGTGEQAFAGLVSGGDERGAVDTTLDQIRYDAEANPTLQMMGSTIGTGAVSYLGGAGLAGGGGRLATALGADALGTGTGLAAWGGRALQYAPKVAGIAGEGGIAGIGAANEQAFLENRQLSAEEVAAAGGVGAALGLGIGAAARGAEFLGGKIRPMVQRVMPEGSVGTFAERQAVKAVADGAPMRGNLRRALEGGDASALPIGRRALDEGILEAADKGGARAAVDLAKEKLAAHGSTYERIAAAADDHVDAAWMHERLQQEYETLARGGAKSSGAKLAKQIDAELGSVTEKMRRGEPVGFEDVKEARTRLAEMSREGDYKGAKKKAFDRINEALTSTLDDAVKRADAQAGEGSKLLADWKNTNKAYHELSTIKDSYSGKLAAETRARYSNHSDRQMGLGSAVLGSMFTGSPVSGALLGFGATAARKAIREHGSSWLARAADAMSKGGEIPSITKLLAASSQARQELGHVAVSQLAQKGAKKVVESEAPAGFGYGALAHYTDRKKVGEQYAAATNYLERSNGDIEGMAGRMNEHLGAIAREQPELAAAAQVQTAKAINYLRDTQPPHPQASLLSQKFGTASAKLPPTADQIAWLKRFRATVDPSVIYGEIARGYVNPETIDTLQTLYPAYLATVQQGVLSAIHTNPDMVKDLPYSKRIMLDNLMGQGQVEPTRGFSVQERLIQANAEATENAQAPMPPSARKPPQIARFEATQSDKLMTPTLST